MTDPSPDTEDEGTGLDLENLAAGDLADLMATTPLTSVDITQAYFDRIRLLNSCGPGLNAVRRLDPTALEQAAALDAERAAGALRGPLHGIPVLIKDNIDVAGSPTTAGSLALEHSYPAGDAPLVQALRAAGLVVLGKANLSEFAYYISADMPSGYSSLGGQVLNPYDVSITPSGSSSGTAVAVAAAMAPLGVGTETSGSILSPAASNSLVAVKPTVGLISRTGVVPLSATQDTPGPMTTTVRDAALLLTALVTPDPLDPVTAGAAPFVGHDYAAGLSTAALRGTRIGYVPGDEQLLHHALEVLRGRGAELVEVTIGGTSAPNILAQEFRRDLDSYLAGLPDGAPMRSLAQVVEFNRGRPEMKFGQPLLERSLAVDLGDRATRAEYEADLERGLRESRAALDDVLAEHDLTAIASFSWTTEVAARAGYPTVAVPAGYFSGDHRPGNLAFTGTAWSEQTLLALAHDYEQATLLRRPPSMVNPTLFRSVDPGATSKAP